MSMNLDAVTSAAIRASCGLLALMAVQVLVATPLLSWRLLLGGPAWMQWAVGIALAAAIVALLVVCNGAIQRLAATICSSAMRPPRSAWLLSLILTGLALRLAWVWIYPAAPASDGATYLALAERLSRGGTYEMAGTKAYWPPGYPLLLTPWVFLFGTGSASIAALNLLLYVGTLWATYRLVETTFGELPARLASLLICLWPSLIAMTGLPEKEQPVILLVTLAYLTLYGSRRHLKRHWLVAGSLVGLGCLIQPSLLLLPATFLLADLLLRRPAPEIACRMLLIAVGMLLVISPWTLRNYAAFDRFVLISTNGGSNFYRANNPLATGGYTDRGEVDMSDLNEIEANLLGATLGREWIKDHPRRFLELAVEKHILFLGDDSYGVYASLRRGSPEFSSVAYATWKAVANAFWIAAWSMILTLGFRGIQARVPLPASNILPFAAGILYFWALHGVFESNGKYHLPVITLIATLTALALQTTAQLPSKGPRDSPSGT